MWHWQPRKRKHFFVWGHLFFCISLLHVVFLSPFFIFAQKKSAFHLSVHKNPLDRTLPVVFLPLRASVAVQRVRPVAVAQTSKKVEVAQNKKPAPKAQAAKSPLKTVLAQAAQINKKKEIAHVKKIEPKKPEIKQAKLEKIQPEVAPKEEIKQEIVAAPITQPDIMSTVDAIYIGRQELEQLAIEQYIQQEIGIHWRPPQGLSDQLSCEIKLVIGGNGTIAESFVAKSSGVLVYDIAAESALLHVAHLPAWAHNKEFFITFK